jgi:hypothetical protein
MFALIIFLFIIYLLGFRSYAFMNYIQNRRPIYSANKQINLQAIEFTGDNTNQCNNFCNSISMILDSYPPKLSINTKEGLKICSKGDYIVKNKKGQIFVATPDEIFLKSFQ